MRTLLVCLTLSFGLSLAGCGGGDNGDGSKLDPIDPPTTNPPVLTPSQLTLEQYQQILSWENSYIVNSSDDAANHFEENTINIDVFANDPQPYSVKYSPENNTFEEEISYTQSTSSDIWNGTSWNLVHNASWLSSSDQMQVMDDHLFITSASIDTNFKLYAEQIDLSKDGALNKALNIEDVSWSWINAHFEGFGYKVISVPTQALIVVDSEDSLIAEGSITDKTVDQIAQLIIPQPATYELVGDDAFRVGEFTWKVKHDTVANLNVIRISSSYAYAGAYSLLDWALIDYQGAIHEAVLIEPEHFESLQLAEPNIVFSFENAIKAIIHLQNLVRD
ncbi:hypothetical protein ACVFI8_15050 [Agarivorans sp. MS3-6]